MKNMEAVIISKGNDVEAIDDSTTYEELKKSDPDGLSPANEEEQQEFRKWLDI